MLQLVLAATAAACPLACAGDITGPGSGGGGGGDSDGGAAVPPGPTDGGPDAAVPSGRFHLDVDTVARINEVAASTAGQTRSPSRFMKVGDSNTETPLYLSCLDSYVGAGTSHPDLGDRPDMDAAIDNLAGESADATSTWARNSDASYNGASTWWFFGNGVGPANSNVCLDCEIDAANPRYAVVMLGTNDIAAIDNAATFKAELDRITAYIEEEGIIPILSTLPPYATWKNRDASVDAHNQAIRELADERHIPLMDYFAGFSLDPPRGGVDNDSTYGVHPEGYMGGCVFDQTGLEWGFNLRNHMTLDALAEVSAAVN